MNKPIVNPGQWDAYIGLGGNLQDPVAQLRLARAKINALEHVRERGFSPFYRSAPFGPPGQPDYVNAVAHVRTSLSALQLLYALQQIENSQGRERHQRWGARTLDLDILLFGAESINLPELKIPHPEMTRRAFVLYPLADIAAPDLTIPGVGALSDCLAACPPQGIWKLPE